MWRAAARLKIRSALCGAPLLCLSAVALSGCGVTGRAGAEPPARSVKVTERDFRIQAPRELAAGDVRLSVHNEGPDMHELIIVREGSGPLPLRERRPDGRRGRDRALHGGSARARPARERS